VGCKRKMKKYVLNKKIKIKKLVDSGGHYFFGYFGKSPWSKGGRYAVCLEVGFIDRHPRENDSANIMLIDFKNKSKKKIAETRAWNWQQGCMMQWMPTGFDKEIIFNDRKDGKFVSRILDVETLKEKVVPYPIYDVHPSGEYALSVSFEKLNSVRTGYGYAGGLIEDFTGKISKDEGVYLINLKNNKRKLIVKLSDLYNYKNLKSMDKGRHWIDQPVFNPSGDRFCFLHRWEIDGGLFHSRFFSVGIDGKDLFMFPDSGFYSHFCWKSSEEILMFCSVSEKFGNIRSGNNFSKFLINWVRPVYRSVVPRSIRKRVLPVGYFLLKDLSKEMRKIDVYNDDGHMSFSKDGRYLITDTYPNSRHYRKLILYDWKRGKRTVLGEFYSLPDKKYLEDTKISEYGKWGSSPLRVDLHPRWDFKGKKVCFDSIHEGKRGIYFLEMREHGGSKRIV